MIEGKRPTERTELSLFELLMQDHQRAMMLFAQIEHKDKKDIDGLLNLFSEIEEELKVHLEGEERFFYTALESHQETSDKILQSYEEHLVIKTVIGGFNSLALDDPRWHAKLMVLKELFELHVRQENQLFNSAKTLLSQEQLRQITEQMQELRKRGSTMRALGESVADT